MSTYCIFAAHYLPYLGGVERYTYNLTKELVKKGHKVIIITSEQSGESTVEETAEATVFRLPCWNLLNGRFPVTLYGSATRKLMKQVREFPIDYVIVNTRFYLLSYIGVAFGRKIGVPTVVIEHGTGHFTVNHRLLDFCGHIYEHFISALVKTKAQKFYGVSEACNQWLSHFNINASGVFYNAIDLDHILRIVAVEEKRGEQIKETISYSEQDVIVTYTGRLVKEKGVLKLIDAVNTLHPRFPNIKLCIAGDGPLLEEVRSYAKEGIFVLGRLAFEDVVQLLKFTDIYCLPTDYPEGLPTSVLEAIACKAYVITTMCGGSKEVISTPEYGTILEENTYLTVAQAIEHVLTNSTICKKIVGSAYKRLQENFTWGHTTKKIEEALSREHSIYNRQ